MTRLLVVDDDPDIRGLWRQAFVEEGYEVDAVANGREALRAMQERLPAIMLLDMVMPEVNGWEVLRTCSTSPELASVAIVTLSAGYQAELGAMPAVWACLDKPVDLDLLVSTVGKIAQEQAQGSG